ncbi:5-formyltetrahydrofolate cyclo-ligase [Pedococcus bigeumensis]|uniref:Ligase n=1 Tax=Pedococcus bigeumensis TaxID=433644 RepID=A0A502CQC7_9MICO|nr:5-formyltetrahydrofolate cyclo-ligase [Pedococcus bigeumensis]TPG13901.1 ligase [Pedococcus bigeumensis]
MPSSRKSAVRARLRALRRERVPARDRARDAEELALSALEVVYAAGLGRGDWVAAYEATPLEPPMEAMVDALSARGIRVMVPVTLENWDLDWREVGSAAGAAATDMSGTGTLGTETLGTEAIRQAKVVFLPAHGVDPSGTRIGQGKGCYDLVIPRTSARLVAVVHPWEVLDEELPSEPHDRRVNAVMAAELGVVEVGRADDGSARS